MERTLLIANLATAERHVIQGTNVVTKQIALIARLAKGGHATARAAELLREFQNSLSIFIDDRDRLKAEVAKFV